MNFLKIILGLLISGVFSSFSLRSQSDTTSAALAYSRGLKSIAQNQPDDAFAAFGHAADLFFKSGHFARRAECILQQCEVVFSTNTLIRDSLIGVFQDCIQEISDPFRAKSLEVSRFIMTATSTSNDSIARRDLELAKNILSHNDSLRNVFGPRLFFEIGLRYLNNQDLDSARVYFEKALPLVKSHSDTELLGDIYIRLGQVYRRRGDPHKAINFIAEAISSYEKKFGSTHTKIAASYNDLSIVQKLLGEMVDAENSLMKALQIREKLLGRKSQEYGMVLNNLALHYLQVEQLDEAIRAAKETVLIFENSENPDQRFHVSAYNTLAQAYDQAGALQEAKKNYQKAVDLHLKYFPANSRIRFYLLDLGRNAMARNEFREAIMHFHQAMSAAIPEIDPDSLDQNPSRDNPSNYLSLRSLCLLKASALHQLYYESGDTSDLLKAIELYELADLFTTKNRVEVQYQKSREAFSRQNLSLYEGAILAHIDMWEETGEETFLEKSFLLNEKSKSLTLLQNLLDANAMYTSGIPQSVLQEEENLQDSLAILRNTMLEVIKLKDSTSLERIRSKIRQLDFKYEAFKRSLEQNYPQYHQSKYNFNFKTLKEIRDQLLSDQSIIEYFIGDEHLFVYTINADFYKCHKIVKSASLLHYITGLIESLKEYDPSVSLTSETGRVMLEKYVDFATKVYDLIWRPFATDLKNEVMVIPDAVLNYLPFGALLSSKPARLDHFKSYPFLEFEHILSYNYSATLADQMKYSQGTKSTKVLAIAPNFSKQEENDLKPLLFNREEAKKVKDIIGGQSLMDDEATGKYFREMNHRFGIFHFATHAVVDENNPDYSFLAFQPDAEIDRLYLHELYNIGLSAHLVTLSACETNVGPLMQGEGIASLAKGFSYAGTKSIVTSLWDVDDLAALEIMESFYEKLADGIPKNHALHMAKELYLRKSENLFGHPLFWATFIPIGDMSYIEIDRPNVHFTWSLTMLGLVILTIFYLIIRK